jgi:mono/diheme cytochrome c family protein
LLLLVAALAVGCDLPGKPNPEERPLPAEQVTDFNTLYATHCAGCHGTDGKLGPAPPLNDPVFLAIVPDEELFHVITEGRAVTKTQRSLMPAFGLAKRAALTADQAKVWQELKEQSQANPRLESPLTATQIKVLAEGIKQRWGGAKTAGRSIPPYRSERKSGGDKAAGIRAFMRACASCHGSRGQGQDEGEQPVGAINDPDFLAVTSDQALRRLIITGRPDLGMPPFDGKDNRGPDFQPLTSAEIDGLVALLASWRSGGTANGK